MVCARVRNLLSAYLDLELDGQEMLSIRRHLSDCGRCRSEREALLQVRHLMRALPAVEPPHGVPDRLVERLSSQPGRARRPVWADALPWLPLSLGNLRLAPMAAAAVLCLAGGLVWAGVRQPQHPDTVVAMVRPDVSFTELNGAARSSSMQWPLERLDAPSYRPARSIPGYQPAGWSPIHRTLVSAPQER